MMFQATDTMTAKEWLDGIFKEAFRRGASDIFIDAIYDDLNEIVAIEPELRIDGWNIPEEHLADYRAAQVIVLIKNEAEMGTSALNAPAEGRYPFKWSGDDAPIGTEDSLDVRVTIFPTVRGEFVSMRIPPVGALPELSSLGISEYNSKRLYQLLDRPQGLIELAGPMGSGKTTTMYSVMKIIGGNRRSVVTVEDPKERTLDGARQMVINPQGGMTYAAVLKSLLRVVMDAMLIGEIRDPDTASAAVKFSTSGTKVLSSIHSGDPVAAIARTIDLSGSGVIAAMEAINGIMSQRLIRTFHQNCKGKGCAGCEGTGYKGRKPVHEVLINSSQITDLMLRGAPRADVHRAAREEGMISFHEDADRLLDAGLTDRKSIADAIGHDTRQLPGSIISLAPSDADSREQQRGSRERQDSAESREAQRRAALGVVIEEPQKPASNPAQPVVQPQQAQPQRTAQPNVQQQLPQPSPAQQSGQPQIGQRVPQQNPAQAQGYVRPQQPPVAMQRPLPAQNPQSQPAFPKPSSPNSGETPPGQAKIVPPSQ